MGVFSKETEKRVWFFKGFGAMFAISAVFFISYSVVTSSINSANEKESLAKEKAQEVTVYEISNKIQQGNTINLSDIKPYSCPKKDAVQGALTKANIIGKVARIDLNPNTQITASMITDSNDVVTADLRNQDYSDITLSKNLKVGDYIDIREKKKDGSDYVVVAKKKVLAIINNTIVIDISDNERKFKNNATVDAALTGGTLYTTIYPDPENQPAAAVTYVFNNNIDKMIQSNSQILKNSSQTLMNNNNNSSTTTKPSFANSTN